MPRRHDIEIFLRRSELFRLLPAKERKRISDFSHERVFPKGDIIFREGVQSDSVWLLLEGQVHLAHFTPEGRSQTSCVITSGESFCCLPALDRGTYPATAIAARPSRVLQIPSSLFHELMRGNPAMMQETLCVFSGRLRQMEAKGCLIHDPVERRVAQVLLSMQRKFGDEIPLTRQEIADLAGTTVESAIRTIGRFQQEGWIRSSRGKVQLLQPVSLKQITE